MTSDELAAIRERYAALTPVTYATIDGVDTPSAEWMFHLETFLEGDMPRLLALIDDLSEQLARN